MVATIFQVPIEEVYNAWITNSPCHSYFASSAALGIRSIGDLLSIRGNDLDSTAKQIAFIFLGAIAGLVTLAAGIVVSPFLLIGSCISRGIEKIREKKQKTNECGVPIVNKQTRVNEEDDDDDSSVTSHLCCSYLSPIKASDFFNNSCKKLKKLFTKESSESNPDFHGQWGFTENEAYGSSGSK